MKHLVVTSELSGSDIRPPAALDKFRELSLSEAHEYFHDTNLVEVPCPACGAPEPTPAFKKGAWTYAQCNACHSIYVTPRPTQAALVSFYQNSKAAAFRVEYFARAAGSARLLHVLRSRLDWLLQFVNSKSGSGLRVFADVGTHYPELFDAIQDAVRFDERYGLNLHPDVQARLQEMDVFTARFDDAIPALNTVTAFEQLEHKFSPLDFLRKLHDHMADDGMLFFTARTISGFDLQVLWDQTPYIFVPEHLNLLSIEGLAQLVRRAGFELEEVSTPGQLDVEFVQQALEKNPELPLPRFMRYMLSQRDTHTHAEFQTFLQKNRLSSHVRIAAKK